MGERAPGRNPQGGISRQRPSVVKRARSFAFTGMAVRKVPFVTFVLGYNAVTVNYTTAIQDLGVFWGFESRCSTRKRGFPYSSIKVISRHNNLVFFYYHHLT